MPDGYQFGQPVNFCVDRDSVNSLLRASSLNVAMASRTTVQAENVSNAVLDWYLFGLSTAVLGPVALVGGYLARRALTDAARVDVIVDDALKADAARIHQRYCDMFKHYAARGMGFRYLCEVRDEGYRAWCQVQDRFEEARRVNNAITGRLSTVYDWTARVKVAADVGMVIVGAIVPLGFVANSAAGLGYSLACRFANTVSEAGSSDFQSYSRTDFANDASGVGGNKLQELADNAAEDARALQAKKLWMALEAEAEKQGRKLEEALNYVREGFQSGQIGTAAQRAAARAGFSNPMTSAQELAARKLAEPLEIAAEKAAAAAAAARNVARPPASVNALESFHNAPSMGTKLGVAASRGVAIGVGIYFLKDAIIDAWKGQTAADERHFREAHGLAPRP